MTATATETHTLVSTDGKPQITRTPKPATIKPTVTKPAAKPADKNADGKEGARLETIALRFRGQAMTAAVKLAETFVAMHPYAPWGTATPDRPAMALEKYFRDVMGVGAGDDLFKLPRDARQAVVKGMFTRDNNTDLILDICAMTGAGERTIARDRSELGFANENRSDAHTKPKTDDNESDAGDDTAKPAKASKPKAAGIYRQLDALDLAESNALLAALIQHIAALTTAAAE